METIDILLLWTIFSIIISFIWSITVNEPGSTEISDIIWTVICGLLALPLTVILIIVFFIVKHKIKNYDRHK
jgi:hypothetical protein